MKLKGMGKQKTKLYLMSQVLFVQQTSCGKKSDSDSHPLPGQVEQKPRGVGVERGQGESGTSGRGGQGLVMLESFAL